MSTIFKHIFQFCDIPHSIQQTLHKLNSSLRIPFIRLQPPKNPLFRLSDALSYISPSRFIFNNIRKELMNSYRNWDATRISISLHFVKKVSVKFHGFIYQYITI